MLSRQKQVVESYARVRAFVEANPATGQPGFESAKAALDEALARLREYASVRLSGQELGRAELRRRDQMIVRIRDRHMRPIVTIARGQVAPQSDVRLPAALRMPKEPLSVTRMLQSCDAMIEAARPFESVLVANGLEPDFLAQLKSARDALEGVVASRATLLGARLGAKKGLQVQLVLGRRAVDRLDAVVRARFEGEEAILTTWRNAKRIQRLPRAVGGAGVADAAGEVAAPVAPVEVAMAA